jgi:hypothetical protein
MALIMYIYIYENKNPLLSIIWDIDNYAHLYFCHLEYSLDQYSY